MRERARRKKEFRWEKLDNTANLFPVIATENMTNVYRIAVTLNQEIQGEILQKALDKVLPMFDLMNVRMKTGIFWYYFETNKKPAPLVEEEKDYPCRYIEHYANRNYLFRVSYYKCRINLEVFHVLADGMGGVTFLKELTYQYLRMIYPELCNVRGDELSETTSLNTEDSYLKNYRKSQEKTYKTRKAVRIKGEKLEGGELGIIHGYLSIPELKEAAKKRGVSINEYLAGIYVYSIYKEYLHGGKSSAPIATCIPVNLRPYFDSMTTRNFFVMVNGIFQPTKEDYTFQEVLDEVTISLSKEINKENLEKTFSYNVSNQKNLILRSVPLFVKKLAIKYVYYSSARATTTTMTNIGVMTVEEEYQPYIKRFYAMINMSTGQNIKGTICSYNQELAFTFTSVLADVSIQKRFFTMLGAEGVPVTIETNGVYYE